MHAFGHFILLPPTKSRGARHFRYTLSLSHFFLLLTYIFCTYLRSRTHAGVVAICMTFFFSISLLLSPLGHFPYLSRSCPLLLSLFSSEKSWSPGWPFARAEERGLWRRVELRCRPTRACGARTRQEQVEEDDAELARARAVMVACEMQPGRSRAATCRLRAWSGRDSVRPETVKPVAARSVRDGEAGRSEAGRG